MLRLTFSTVDEEDMPFTPVNLHIPAAETQNRTIEFQLSTPTTKNILEEIGEISTGAVTLHPSSLGVKRNLNFTNTTSNEENPTAANDKNKSTTKVNKQVAGKNALVKSPYKKNCHMLNLSKTPLLPNILCLCYIYSC
ncbi:hypothetical protein ACH5RR_040974 [Cinchona calisaya]|uniref:Uncharacterized protein n=1 Tax=Cinchona calisaya TaxID=153742 RepID=A0ABD2XXF7_9GENT